MPIPQRPAVTAMKSGSVTGNQVPRLPSYWGFVLGFATISPLTAAAETVEGFAEPYHQIQIAGATEPGIITEIRFKEGDAVREGDVLATLDNGVLQASLVIAERRSQMKGRLDAAMAEYRMRRDRSAKLEILRSKGHASPVELDRAQADLEVAQAQVVLAQEELELAELECQRIRAQIEQRMFRSPIDGIVSEVVREEGEAILLNDPALMTLVQLHPLRVKFPVSIHTAETLKANQPIEVEIPDLDTKVTATIEVVAPVLDAKSGTAQITCLIDNQANKLRSGMRCLFRTGPGDDEPPSDSEDTSEPEEQPSDLASDE